MQFYLNAGTGTWVGRLLRNVLGPPSNIFAALKDQEGFHKDVPHNGGLLCLMKVYYYIIKGWLCRFLG